MLGKQIGLLVQFPVGQPLLFADERDAFRRASYLFLEQFMDLPITRVVRTCLVPSVEGLPKFIGRQNIEASDKLPRGIQRRQKLQEPKLKTREKLPVVKRRVSIELDAPRTILRLVVNKVEIQILYRAVGNLTIHALVSGELQIIIERHNVD